MNTNWKDFIFLVFLLIVFISPAIILLATYNSRYNELNNQATECCEVQGGTPVVYSGCHSNFYANCSNAKSGWYCLLEDSEINYTETFKGCSIQYDKSKDKR